MAIDVKEFDRKIEAYLLTLSDSKSATDDGLSARQRAVFQLDPFKEFLFPEVKHERLAAAALKKLTHDEITALAIHFANHAVTGVHSL